MGRISDRIMGSVDEFAAKFGDRLGTWGMSLLTRGATKTLEDMEPTAIIAVQERLLKIREEPDVPDDMKEIIDRALTPGNPLLVVLAVLLVVVSMTGTLGALFAPLNRVVEYKVDRGVNSFRMDPMSIITAWRRDPEKYAFLFDDLEEKGWSDKKIEALKFLTLFYPAPADLVRWQAREVFEPAMIAKYGLDSELGEIERDPFYKAGMTDEQITNYWRAHWEHASWMQIVEMLHRGLVTEEDVWDWFRLVEIPPFWRQLLIDTAYTWPTRVDVRRWWDMRTIDEDRLRELYSGMGYRGKNLDDYVLWTKVYVAFPDLMARWSKGWITLEEVRSELTDLGMPAERLEEFIQMKVKATEPERIEDSKALTKTEIYKGVKKELITWDEGIELLMDLGYDYDEAEYILAVNVGVLEGSPETFAEFKDWTTRYKIAAGREEKPMPEELKAAADEVIRLTSEVEALERSIAEEEAGLIDVEPLPKEATARLTELQVAKNRAISELERVKSEYDRLVAEWKHGLP